MNTHPHRRTLIALTLLAPMPSLVHAHGNQPHGHQGHNGPVVREQKPWGIAAEPREARRTIEILMTDDVIGTRQELEAHAEMLKKHPNMEHDEPYMAHVEPGQRGDIVWTFNRPGDFEFACLIPGHFEAGMRGTIRVTPRNT